tara:strand:+ start:53744 stop:54172 length:429 start_codon:yes stop_codon:yes gene_type:complete
MTPERLIKQLGLQPHPEGGHYREIFRSSVLVDEKRAASTSIYYLLQAGEVSHWHRIDADECWHHYAGSPLILSLSDDGTATRDMILGTAFERGEEAFAVAPKGVWQSAKTMGDWSLVGCSVAPGFQFGGFEMAPADWQPGQG